MNPLLLLGILGAGALALSVRAGDQKPAGAPYTQPIHAGETWMITIRAVGAKFDDTVEPTLRQMAEQYGKVQSIVMSPGGDMVVVIVTYSKNTQITVNQLMALTTSPGKGTYVSDAQQVPNPETVAREAQASP